MEKRKKPFPRSVFRTAQKALFAQHQVLQNAKPLKRGILKDLCEAHPEHDHRLVYFIMRGHTQSLPYLQALANGGKRHDMQGVPVEDVKESHQNFAKSKLKHLVKHKNEKEKHRKDTKKAVGKRKVEVFLKTRSNRPVNPLEGLKVVRKQAATDQRPKPSRPVLKLKRKQASA